jgi:hypothetical protein
MKETVEQMKKTDKIIDPFGSYFDGLADHLVKPGIEQSFNALGHHFNDFALFRKIKNYDGQRLAEFDILMENETSSIGVEVKSKPTARDVTDHKRRLEVFREYKNKVGDTRKIHGAIAGAVMPRDVRTAALKAGFYVIVQAGDTMKIDVPEGFVPRAW